MATCVRCGLVMLPCTQVHFDSVGEPRCGLVDRCDERLAVRYFAGLDLSNLYAPTAGDAIALRGEAA